MFAPEHEDWKCRGAIRSTDRAVEPSFVDSAVRDEDEALDSIGVEEGVFERRDAEGGSCDQHRSFGADAVHESPQPRPESREVSRDFGRVDAMLCGNCVEGFRPEWLSHWSSR